LGRTREFARVVRAFAPFAPTLMFSKTVNTLLTLHPLDIDSPCSNSLLNFQFDSDLELSMDFYRSIFLTMSHLSTSGPFGMVFEHFRNFFDLEDSTNGFIQLH
jgi:hypothetical protein